MLTLASDYMHEDSVGEFVAKRDQLGAWIVACGNLEGAIVNLRDTLGLGPDETADDLCAARSSMAAFDAATARASLSRRCRARRQPTSDAAERLAPYCRGDRRSTARMRRAGSAFFTTKDDGELARLRRHQADAATRRRPRRR